MEKGKAKASKSQEKKSTRVTCKQDQDKMVNFQGENASLSTSQNERGGMNDQLATYQGSSGTREQRSMFGSDMFEDPFFKDPFFTRPFGEPFKSNGLLRPDGIFSNGIFDIGRNLLDRFHSNNPPMSFSESHDGNGPIEGGRGKQNIQIEEVPKYHTGFESGAHNFDRQPIIEHPDDDDNRGSFHLQQKSPHFNSSRQESLLQPGSNQENTSSFYISSVMCAGSDGPYYASQTTRRQGPNGVVEEEHQEKDSSSGRAHHRVSHGLGEKGHSIIKERKKNGQDTKFERFHNLEKEEVPRFESEWETLAEKHLPKWPINASSSLPGPSLRSCSRAALPPGGSSPSNQH